MNEQVFLYDTNANVGENIARSLGETVHSWHPKLPNRDEPEVTVFPISGGVLLKHGGSFKKFKGMFPVYLKMEGSNLGHVTSLHWRGDELVDELLEACGQGE